MAQWLTEDDSPLVEELWPGAPDPDGPVYPVLMAGAQAQCEAYAPPLGEDADVPDHYKLALIMQARDLYRSLSSDPDGQFGPDGLPITTWPMGRTVKSILRPAQGAGKRGAF